MEMKRRNWIWSLGDSEREALEREGGREGGKVSEREKGCGGWERLR